MKDKLYFMEPTETLSELQDYYFPPYITLAHMFHAPEGWGLKPRILKQFQIQYVVEGSADYTIGDRLYATKRGDLLLHRPNEIHAVQTKSGEPYVCLSIVFHFGAVIFPMHRLIEHDAEGNGHLMGNFTSTLIEKQCSELVLYYRQPGMYHQLLCQNLLMQILLQLAAAHQDREASEPGKKADANKAKLIQIRNYILSRLKEGFHHHELERLTGWSRNHIISQFHKTFGMSPIQYLIWIRIEKAKELALQSGLSFGEIAAEVGYVNIHAFGKIFKRKTGMSLSQFCTTLFEDTPDK
ncbi:AraC family transcriptional regulator [Paenibacillus sp. FSL H8-0034]|uniref:AraC family transcriptional regulator n=1 Tax=Paenibacillus sp. FSL H8-0034 TaxID=2954671 RepID=UPI0030F928CB